MVLAALGAALLGWLIHHAGVDQIHERMDEIGGLAPLVLLPWIVIAVIDALGWRCALPPAAAARVPLGSLAMVRVAGEAVSGITPTGGVGEPVKAHLLRAWGVAGSDSLASIVIAKTALTVSQSLFVVLGVAALFVHLGRPVLGTTSVLLLLVATAGFAVLLIRLQRRGPAATVWGWARRLAPRAHVVSRLERTARAIDTRLEDFYRIERPAFRDATLWHFAGWLLGVSEVWLIMFLIGAPVSWLDALTIEALSQPIRAAALIIPGGLGTQEWGGVWLCVFLGMSAPDAATLWLLKRGRELVFTAAGLVYLGWRSARHPTGA